MRSAKDFGPWDAISGGGLKQSVRLVHSVLAAARYDSNRRDRTRTRFSSQSLTGKGTFGRT